VARSRGNYRDDSAACCCSCAIQSCRSRLEASPDCGGIFLQNGQFQTCPTRRKCTVSRCQLSTYSIFRSINHSCERYRSLLCGRMQYRRHRSFHPSPQLSTTSIPDTKVDTVDAPSLKVAFISRSRTCKIRETLVRNHRNLSAKAGATSCLDQGELGAEN
jgi:hypothetical protein